jgi:hypothetical protein
MTYDQSTQGGPMHFLILDWIFFYSSNPVSEFTFEKSLLNK